MAKDDYEVIVYQILAYLYNCLKKNIDIELKYIEPQGKLFNIPTQYWQFIICNLYNDDLIEGIILTKVWGEKYPIISELENVGITPKGIQYVTDNSFINRASEMLKDVKSIIPFV